MEYRITTTVTTDSYKEAVQGGIQQTIAPPGGMPDLLPQTASFGSQHRCVPDPGQRYINQGYIHQSHLPQRSFPFGHPYQPCSPQLYPSQAYPSQAYPSQAYPSQAYPSQAYPSQAYPYPGQGYQMVQSFGLHSYSYHTQMDSLSGQRATTVPTPSSQSAIKPTPGPAPIHAMVRGPMIATPACSYAMNAIKLPQEAQYIEAALNANSEHQQLMPVQFQRIQQGTMLPESMSAPNLGMIIIWKIRLEERLADFTFELLPPKEQAAIKKIMTAIKEKITTAEGTFVLCRYIQESNKNKKPLSIECPMTLNPKTNDHKISVLKSIYENPEAMGKDHTLDTLIDTLNYFCRKFIAKGLIPMQECYASLFRKVYAFCWLQMKGVRALHEMNIHVNKPFFQRLYLIGKRKT